MPLFKYFKPELFQAALRDRTVRLSPPRVLNDPFDGRAHIGQVVDAHVIATWLRQEDTWGTFLRDGLRDRAPHLLRPLLDQRAVVRLLDKMPGRATFIHEVSRSLNQFLMGDSDFKDRVVSFADSALESHLESFGAVSFTASATSTLMWAHYGASSTGFAVEYDPNGSGLSDATLPVPLGRPRRVRYYDSLPTVNFRYLSLGDNAMRIATETLFFRKLKQWAYERETRLVLPLAAADAKIQVDHKDVFLRLIPPATIRSVILGVDASDRLLEAAREIAAYNHFEHIRLFRASANRRYQRIVLTEVSRT